MGLSGRRVKQRIPNDPRNLSWADDAARFGSNYLAKFGWDSSKGLGAGGDGRTSHIKVDHKLDMLGIGAAHTRDPNGIAWKQNRDFENLLKRLNADSPDVQIETEEVQISVESRREETTAEKEESEEGTDQNEKKERKKGKSHKKEKKEKTKRKHRDDGEEEEEEGKKKKKRRKTEDVEDESPRVDVDVEVKEEASAAPVKRAPVPHFRAHRARAIAAKSISSKSSIHISEILGVAPSQSTSQSTSGSTTPADQGKLTSISDIPDDKITTSTKSVMDYFKEKMQAKAGKASSGTTTPLLSDTDLKNGEDFDDRPRGSIGFSRLRFEVREEDRMEEETIKMGLSKFSSLMSSTFLSATASSTEYNMKSLSSADVTEVEDVPEPETPEQETREERKKRRKERKEQKRIEKEERERGGQKNSASHSADAKAEAQVPSNDGRKSKSKKKKGECTTL